MFALLAVFLFVLAFAFLALEKGVSEVYIKNWADITLAGGTMLKL
jgi:hypothetical protein